MIVLLLQSLTALTQDSTSSIVQAWQGPDGSICMTMGRAAKLLNAEDSLQILYIQNTMLENVILDANLVISLSEEAMDNLMIQKMVLQSKIKVLEDRLNLKSDKIMLYLEEIDECSIKLTKANKKLKRQKTATTITSVIGSSAIVAVIVTVLIIVL